MATHTETVMREAVVVTEIGEVPFAEVEFIVGTTIAEDEDVTIDDEYTSGGATATEEIFAGEIEDIEFIEEELAYCLSKLDEIKVIRPEGTYIASPQKLIVDIINDNCATVDVSDTYGYYQMFTDSFNDETAGTNGTTIAFIDVDVADDAHIDASKEEHLLVLHFDSSVNDPRHNFSSNPTSGTIELWVLSSSYGAGNNPIIFYNNAGDEVFGINFDTKLQYWDGAWKTLISSPVVNQWYHIRFDFECGAGVYKTLAADTFAVYVDGIQIADDVSFDNAGNSIDYVEFNATTSTWIDAFGYSWDSDYDIGENLNYVNDYIEYALVTEYDAETYILDAEKNIENFLDEFAIGILNGWYFDNENKLYCNSLDVDSGYDITTSTEIISLNGNWQIKQIDKVILLGGWLSDGTRLRVTSGAGDNIFKDSYNNITNEDLLQSIADNLVTQKQLHPVTIEIEFVDATEGNFQIGETVTVGAGLIFDNSETSVPTGQYIIRKSEFDIITKISFLILDDGLVFKKRGGLPEENTELIQQNRAVLANNDVYGSGWDGDIDPPSKDAVYDKIEALDTNLCRIESGIYTGDGTLANEIILGDGSNEAIAVWIYETVGADGACVLYFCIDADTNDRACLIFAAVPGQGAFDNRLYPSTNGFTVDADGADAGPNKNNQVYSYVALY